MYSFHRNLTSGEITTICDLPTRRSWINANGNEYVADPRTVLVNLKNGNITGCDWAPTNCFLNPTSYNLDSVCARSCINGNCASQDLKIFVAWTGTDANGKQLTSYGEIF